MTHITAPSSLSRDKEDECFGWAWKPILKLPAASAGPLLQQGFKQVVSWAMTICMLQGLIFAARQPQPPGEITPLSLVFTYLQGCPHQ